MYRMKITWLLISVGIFFASVNLNAQEFPVAVGNDSTFAGGAAFDGVNCLLPILGDSSSSNSITAQLISYPGSLIGQRISLNAQGTLPEAIFDGTNYFLVWCGFDGVLRGQLISTAGNLIGSSFSISNNVSIEREFLYKLAYGENSSLVVFVKTDNFLYGQIVDKNGNLVGSQIPISGNKSREVSLAFDGTNYLVTWVEVIPSTDKDIYGQLVSKSGSLVGTNFVIDNGPYFSDNPISLAFDGTRYLLAYHETPSEESPWTLVGRFITTSGTIQESFTICDSSKHPFLPWVAFDGSNYFITWTQFSNNSLVGRFFTTSGTPVNEPTVLFEPAGNKVPVGGVGFGGSHYLAVATKVDSNFSDGDVYGRFVDALTGVKNQNSPIPEKFKLYQNYPNPFNSTTTINYSIPKTCFVRITVYDLLGKEIETLVNHEQTVGNYKIDFDGDKLTSGIYFYRIQAGNFSETKKLILLK